MEPKLSGDEIVISGIAGKFPNSENIRELQKNLLNKTDCIGDSNVRWDNEHPQIPSRIGTIKNIDTFDRVFFGVHGKMVDYMDPLIRITIETAYEAITDAGINPKNLKGSKSAVFTGISSSESEKSIFYEKFVQNGYGLLGINRAMLPNRISFFFGLTGPSVNIDSSCCGGANALHEGFMAIRDGRAENAIIGASNVVLHPQKSLQLFLLGHLSPDGKTKSFDDAANGYTRSEGSVVLFLQKARDAKRIYAEVKNANICFGINNNDNLLFYPSHDSQANIMRNTLKECGLSGKDISFIEADGSGIKVVDSEEVKAIDEVYNEGRKLPLYIGSVKSNLGSCEATNPLIGIIKIITAMEFGYIPPNLHFKKISDKIPALKEGRCKVVTELTPWTGDYAVVNSLAITGASANIILKDFKKYKKNSGKPDDCFPRLVICSGCTEEAVNFILCDLERRSVDVEMLQLMYDIFETEIPAHMYRGYTLLSPNESTKCKAREIQYISSFKKEIWYMFSGMGSQWTEMGKALLQIPVFEEGIKKCDKVLKTRGIDIFRIITENDPKIFDNIINAFVGIAAIQIGLVDLLNSIGLKPDFVIGHSIGELGCAYADECLTAEQMILCALARGLASIETDMIKGSMAAVGLGYKKIKNLCPPDIEVACHNSEDNCTISGPADSLKNFTEQLTANNIFVKEVKCGNIAYHSRYIAMAGKKLRKYLQEIIPHPKLRSNKWISSSVPQDKWNSALGRLSSAEYHTNNFLNHVLFAESAKLIPPHAVVIEIAPHGLLQAIVKKSLPENVLNVPLTKRYHPDNVSFLFEALGKVYNAGCNFKVSNLYPKISYPVSRGTPSISSLIKWDHSTKWNTNSLKEITKIKKGEMNFVINLKNDEWKYLKHARINGKIVIPNSMYLTLAWDVLKSLQNNSEFSILYQNVTIHKQQVEIPDDENIVLVTMVQKGSGFFQVTNNEILLCSGILQVTDAPNQHCIQIDEKDDQIYQYLSESDVYSELQNRGLQYSGPFRTIRKSSTNGSKGTLVWNDNWTSFLDGIIQMYDFGNNVKKIQVPFKIRKIIINLKVHKEIVNNSDEIPVSVYKKLQTISASGVQMEGINFKSILNESGKNKVVVKKIEILPGTDGALSTLSEILNMTLQFLEENTKKSNLISIVDDGSIDVKEIREIMHTVINDTIESRFKIDMVPSSWLFNNKPKSSLIALLVLCNIMQYTQQDLTKMIASGTFFLTFAEPQNESLVLKMFDFAGLGLVLKKYLPNGRVALLFRQKHFFNKSSVLNINDDKDWSNKIRTIITSADCDRLIIVFRSNEYSNLCQKLAILQEELHGNKIQIVDIQDPQVLEFSLQDPLYNSHMDLNLKMNILLPGKIWGTYKYFPIVSNLQNVSNWTAEYQNSSALDSISWVEGFPTKSTKTVKVEYSAINQADFLLQTDKPTLEDITKNRIDIKSVEQEYSGINSKGTRVMGIATNNILSNYIIPDSDFTWNIPDKWSLEDAATVPVAYIVAYLSLVLKGNLLNNESIFLYNASCSIGQAIVNLALNITSQVFLGHTSNRDKNFLKNNYPNIPENNFIQITKGFSQQFWSQTKGKGVNLVIYNNDDLSNLESCVKNVKKFGRIIVIGNLHEAFGMSVGMEVFDENVIMSSIIPKKLRNLNLDTKRKLSQMIENGISRQIVKPIPKRVYPRQMLKHGFINEASKDFFEKIIVKVQPDNGSNTALAVPRFLCRSEGSCLIIEGLNAFGFELVDFLVVRGAKNIIITSESKNTGAYSKHKINLWKKNGVSVVVKEELEFTHQQNVNTLLEEVNALGTIDAIFDLQGTNNLSTRSSSSRYLFTKHLFEESKKKSPDLLHFVVFSTCKYIRGNFNNFLLREIELTKVFQEKTKVPTPGLLILLGPVYEIAEYTTENERNETLLSASSIMEQLDNLIASKASIVSIFHKSLEADYKKIEKENITTEVSARSEFDNYITATQPISTTWRLQISEKIQN